MKASFLILHGLQNHRPPGHWQFQLAAQLSRLGHPVLYPGLPDPDEPSYDAWHEALLSGLAALDPGHRRVVVCHSLACLLWLKAAPTIPVAHRPDRVMLVAAPASAQLPPEAAAFAVDGLDRDAVLASAGTELVFISSDDDPYNPPGARQDYAAELGLATKVVPGGRHFTPDDGYGPWPYPSDWCLGHR